MLVPVALTCVPLPVCPAYLRLQELSAASGKKDGELAKKKWKALQEAAKPFVQDAEQVLPHPPGKYAAQGESERGKRRMGRGQQEGDGHGIGTVCMKRR